MVVLSYGSDSLNPCNSCVKSLGSAQHNLRIVDLNEYNDT